MLERINIMINRQKEFQHLVTSLDDIPKEKITFEKKKVEQSPYRQHFHIESPMGMLGDPNGFSYFNGQYHLFHQWFPMKYSQDPNYFQQGWYHWVSDNLVDWHPEGEAISNDTKYDKYGVYSGSALPIGNKLFLMYNGNSWITHENPYKWQRKPSQLGARMNKENKIFKLKSPLIRGPIESYTSHFRDPKLFKKKDFFYAVIGVQKNNLRGTILLYKSKNLYNWEKVGEIKASFLPKGYMCECPDYYEIGNYGILSFCPQGLTTRKNDFCNAFQACYSIGNHMQLDQALFDGKNFEELDNGFDFYAPQTMLTGDGRRILSAWACIMDSQSPTIKYHYDGCLIFPRVLKVENGRLYQQPVREIKYLYTRIYESKKYVESTLEIEAGKINCRDISLNINFDKADQVIFDIFADKQNQKHLRLIFNKMKQRFIVNRAKVGESFEEEYGTERSCFVDLKHSVKVRIIQDISSAEIFLNDGFKVFTMRVFPGKYQNHIFINSLNGGAKIKYNIYQLRNME